MTARLLHRSEAQSLEFGESQKESHSYLPDPGFKSNHYSLAASCFLKVQH